MQNIIRRAILALVLIAGIAPAIAQVPAPVPALPDTERRTSYSLTASTCACAVNFALYGDSTDYQNWVEVFLNGILVNFNDPAFGWTITSPSGPLSNLARPITNAVLTFASPQTGVVQIVGARRPRRTSQFSENQGVSARNLNQVITDIVAMLREVWDKINDVTGRIVRAPPGETMNTLPPAANRASMNACFDSNGNLVPCVASGSGSFTPGFGITFTGTNPTTISSKLAQGISVTDFGAACDGSTDDTAAFAAALVAANRKVLSLPAGTVCIVQHFDICSNPSCQSGHAGGSVPLIVEGNGATLLAPASTAGAATFVYVEMQTATNVPNFMLRDLIINGGGFVNRGLTVLGCVYCNFVNIGETNAQVIGCHFTAIVGFVLANNLFERIQCNTNNTNSGTMGTGILEDTAAVPLGPSNCTSFAQNAGNTFVSVHALFNGLLGWDVDCANNSHISPDMEQNLSFGLSLAEVSASEWIGAQFSSNKNNRGSAGQGGDASVINNDGSPGIQFFGGASDGTFTNVSAGHGDTLAMHGQTGFGFTPNCGGSGFSCMTLP